MAHRSSSTNSSPRRFTLPPLHLNITRATTDMTSSPMNEKDQLPCIMITPSSPIHERDFQIHYFTPAKPEPGFFASLRDALSFSSPSAISLPESPKAGSPYGHTGLNRPLPASRRFRMLLLLAASVFVGLHIFFLPTAEGGLYDVFSSHDDGSEHAEGFAAPSEVWADSSILPVVTDAPYAVAATEMTVNIATSQSEAHVDMFDDLPADFQM